MALKRRGVKNSGRANYPTASEAVANRRKFLKLLGRSLLAASVFGLAACTRVGRKMAVDAKDAGPVEDEWGYAGGIWIDLKDRQDLVGLQPPPDAEDQWPAPGGLEVLVEEEKWPVPGDLTWEEKPGAPDPEVTPWNDDEDWVPAGG